MTRLSDLCEAEERLSEVVAEVATRMSDYRAAFTSAELGDFDSLLRLVAAFGADSSLTFGLSVRSKASVSLVQAFGLQSTDPDLITYRTRGVMSRTRQQLPRFFFHRLLAIRQL
jgi:hypothetical protein